MTCISCHHFHSKMAAYKGFLKPVFCKVRIVHYNKALYVNLSIIITLLLLLWSRTLGLSKVKYRISQNTTVMLLVRNDDLHYGVSLPLNVKSLWVKVSILRREEMS
jgi:hypothetical protein